MSRTGIRRGSVVAIALLTMGLLASCTPTPPAAQGWVFRATKVTVNDSQDAVYDPLFGLCISLSGCTDEPYILQIGFSVKIGVPGSATASVFGNRDNHPGSLGAGSSAVLTGANQNAANFTITPLDILDLADSNNHLQVIGTYVWALEEDTVGVSAAAGSVASILKDALNQTLAVGALPSDVNQILDLVFSNIGSALLILAQNIPLLGLGDDVMGGAIYVGIAAKGSLGDIINSAIGSTPFPAINIPILDLPPSIDHGAAFATTGTVNFLNQSFSGSGGTHTYDFQSAAS